MAGAIGFDFNELNQLAADLGQVPDNIGPKIHQALEVTATKVKASWRGKLDGAPSLPAAARSIEYRIGNNSSLLRTAVFNESGANVLTADIGPRIGGQGSLVGALEFGTPTLGPRGYGAASLQENQADFRAGLEQAAREAERESNL